MLSVVLSSTVVILVQLCTLSPERQSARMSKITNDGLTPVWHRMLYSCTHMETVGVKGTLKCASLLNDD